MRVIAALTFAYASFAQGFFGIGDEVTTERLFDPDNYGVDVTFPVHHYIQKDTFFKRRYDKWMKDCAAAYSARECEATERARLEMSMSQTSQHLNYTKLGFQKAKVPDGIWKEILAFWEENKDSGALLENWPRGNTYVNAWESPSYMVSFENKNLRGGWSLKQRIWDALNPVLSEWVGGREIEPVSLYGIRVYKRNAYLATHVDRLPLVTSAIIQVAQDVDEPWPAEIYSHDGKAYNVTLQPGEMAMYESHTTLHGRPAPLNGNYFANIFVHFKPLEYDEKVAKYQESLGMIAKSQKSPNTNNLNKKVGGHEHDNHDEDTLKRHLEDIDRELAAKKITEDEARREKEEAIRERLAEREKASPDGRTALHVAASASNFADVERLLKNHNTDMLNARDENGWQAIHEAVRAGNLEIVKYLVDMGADIGSKTTGGGTPLWWARRELIETDPVIIYLVSIGAPDESADDSEEL